MMMMMMSRRDEMMRCVLMAAFKSSVFSFFEFLSFNFFNSVFVQQFNGLFNDNNGLFNTNNKNRIFTTF